MSLQLDTLAYTNRLRQLPPEHKLIFATTVLLIALCSHSLVQVLITVWMSIWTVVYARIPAKIYGRLIYFATFFWIASLPALVLNVTSATPDLTAHLDSLKGLNLGSYYLYMSRSGIEQAFVILTRSLAAVSCMYFVLLTVPFAAILQTLRRLGLPEILTELLLLMYRFIFTLLSVTIEMWTAQQSRCGYRNWRTSMQSLSLLVGQLFERTLAHYRQFSLGLEARGFTGNLRVWHSYRYRSFQRYTLEALLGCAVLIALDMVDSWRNF